MKPVIEHGLREMEAIDAKLTLRSQIALRFQIALAAGTWWRGSDAEAKFNAQQAFRQADAFLEQCGPSNLTEERLL